MYCQACELEDAAEVLDLNCCRFLVDNKLPYCYLLIKMKMNNSPDTQCSSHGCASWRCGESHPAIDTAEALRTFAEQHGELAFAHLVSAALDGEKWVVERVEDAITRISIAPNSCGIGSAAYMLRVIRSTDTTRPDGAIARDIVP